ncbi:hypothetical protein DMC47_41210 [Nostoc sp. 3335mG]|nr:hypothetical protein DMC47_41210 [Nostoc sp. 3335mG]
MSVEIARNPVDVNKLGHILGEAAERLGCSAVDILLRMERALQDEPGDASLYDLARTEKRFRSLRNRHFGVAMFRDPAWDMLLDLIIAEDDRKRLSVTALCLGSGVAPTTALRHLDRLIRHGFVTRTEDQADGRRVFVDLVPARREQLMRLLSDWACSGSFASICARTGPGPQIEPRMPRAHPAHPVPHPVFLS